MDTEPKFLSPEYYVNWLKYAIQESELVGNKLDLKGSDSHGKNFSSIVFNDKENSENTLLDGLRGICQRLEHSQRECGRMYRDSLPWKSAKEIPDGPCSSIRCRVVQVDSGALRFISSFNYGWHDNRVNKWFVVLGSEAVEHAVEQWRGLPRAPGEAPKYELVKDEVERLRAIIDKSRIKK
jgi:hypothetical protein